MTHSTRLLAVLLISAAVLSACNATQPTVPQPEPAAIELSQLPEDGKKKANYEFTAEVENQIALDLLSQNAEIETQDFGEAGAFITSINGLAGNNEYFWAFYVNGQLAQAGASQTVLKKGDTVQFVYEAITY